MIRLLAQVSLVALIACLNWSGKPPTSSIIAIDPGHPSETSSGDEVQNGTTEVEIAWRIAIRLRDVLRQRGYTVVMTKYAQNQMVTNQERAEIGNRANARLMVRLHCDASSDSGFALYYPDRQGTVRGKTGPSRFVIERSDSAAHAMHAAIAPVLAGHLKDGGVRGDSKTLVGSQQGALTGSIFSQIPVVLVEMVTLNNARDAAFIKTVEGQALMVRAIAAGIERASASSQ